MCIDTLKLSRLLIKSNSYTLDKLAKNLNYQSLIIIERMKMLKPPVNCLKNC